MKGKGPTGRLRRVRRRRLIVPEPGRTIVNSATVWFLKSLSSEKEWITDRTRGCRLLGSRDEAGSGGGGGGAVDYRLETRTTAKEQTSAGCARVRARARARHRSVKINVLNL